jgi:hypothetical protein
MGRLEGGGMRFFKLYTDDFMIGTMTMSPAEAGDYIRLLCFLYDHDGRVKNDPYVLRHVLLHCTQTRHARARVQRLIDLGKLSIDTENCLHNGRTDREIEALIGGIKGSLSPLSVPSNTPSGTPKKPMKTTRARLRADDRIQNPDSINSRSSSDDLLFNVRASDEALTHTSDLEQKFVEFWAAYPKREGGNPKHPAKLKFMAAVKGGANPDSIIEAARLLAKEHPTPTRFVPMAQTWLYQHRFADASDAAQSAEDELARQRRMYEERIARERADERQGVLRPLSRGEEAVRPLRADAAQARQ